MKYLKKLITLLCLILFAQVLPAQNSLSEARMKTLKGTIVPFSTATQKDSLILVCFWSTTSDASINELNAINANYDKWKEMLSFKLMAVSVDEGQTANKVRPTVNMNEWKFEVYTDIYGDLRKALGSNNLPQQFIIKKTRVIYEQSGFESGTENYLFQKMQAIAAGKL
ncbi:MAG TPA: redoxin domain-containing protein [Puia sp.]|nr:redoxin domain-containing protein [Puia sp.]